MDQEDDHFGAQGSSLLNLLENHRIVRNRQRGGKIELTFLPNGGYLATSYPAPNGKQTSSTARGRTGGKLAGSHPSSSVKQARLHDLTTPTGVKLPEIVVVGDQTSGMSSTLEAISGIPFPRSSPAMPDKAHRIFRDKHGKHPKPWSQRSRSLYTAPLLDTKPRENRRQVLRIRIFGEEHLACPDSGSDKNIISEKTVKQFNFRVHRRPKDIRRFELGNGNHIWSTGRISLPIEIPGHPMRTRKHSFYVLPDCPVSLVLGIPFLREAEILTKYRYILETCPPNLSNISSLLWIGTPRIRCNQMRCIIDGRELLAVADTGSDLNLMSLECARRENFQIDRRRKARTKIRVGDGTVTETIGQLHVSSMELDWRKPEIVTPGPASEVNGDIEDSEDLTMVFHVLPNLPCDIILGHDFLEATDAFNRCPGLLENQSSKRTQNRCTDLAFNILITVRPIALPFFKWRRKKDRPPLDPQQMHDDERHREMYRRKLRKDDISKLPRSQQDEASRKEELRIGRWVNEHAGCGFCSPV